MMTTPIFRPSFGNRPDRIVGREDVIQSYANSLACPPGSRERAMLLTGQRGMGKTAMLLEMSDLARENGFVPTRVTCGETMLDTLLDVLQRDGSAFVRERRNPIRGFSAGALGFSVGLTLTDEARASYGFRVKLEMICDRLAEAGMGVALLVDEVRAGSAEMRQLATTYQELVGDDSNVAIVMAGLPAVVSEVLSEDTLTFLNRAKKLRLGPVSINSVRAYYASAFERAGRGIDTDTLDAAARATEGFPYLLQLIGYYLLAYVSEGARITPEALAQAEKAARNDLGEDVFAAMLRPLSNADVAFLRAMSRDRGATRVSDLEGRLGVSQGHVQSYRRRLLDAGVIVAPRRGMLSFVIPNLADYLREGGE